MDLSLIDATQGRPYRAAKVCIYCGATAYDESGKPLHDEHIIPYSLGGALGGVDKIIDA
jgi:5-methylcytosine-specific restriction endonuclease McrA